MKSVEDDRTGENTPGDEAEVSHRSIVAELLGVRSDDVVELGAGTDHHAYGVGEDLVARFVGGDHADAASLVRREQRILDALHGQLPVATPAVVAASPESGLLVTTRIPGVALLGHHLDRRTIIGDLADVATALHAIDPTRFGDAVSRDDYPLTRYATDARAVIDELAGHLGPHLTARAFARLAEVPDESTSIAFVHNDLGAEHLFVGADGRLSGVIDWADAAVADPARDLARILRDFGPDLSRELMALYEHRWDAGLEERVWFLARCAGLEDLEYGLTHQQAQYSEAALRAFEWLFTS